MPFQPPSFQSSHRWANIMLLTDGIHTLENVVNIDATRVDLVSQAASSCGVTVMVVAYAKEGFYHY